MLTSIRFRASPSAEVGTDFPAASIRCRPSWGRRRGAGAARSGECGSALLLAVGATAAIAVLATSLLSASLLSYRIAVLEYQGTQARLLADSALAATMRELAVGRMLPAPGAESVWNEVVPADVVRPAGECGFTVRLWRPRAASGALLADPSDPAIRIVDVQAEGRCGRGFAARRARFSVAPGGVVGRLY